MPVITPAAPPAPGVVDERAARRDLCDQIARLERELARTLAAVFPRARAARARAAPPPRRPARGCSRLGQLERIRDELADRVATLRDQPRPRAARGDARARRSATAGSS